MPDFTPEYDLPYPTGVESPNGPAAIKALADAVEAELIAQSTPTFEAVTFNGAWTDFGGGAIEEVSYALALGRVYLRGAAKNATGTTTGVIFTLPDGYRPAKQHTYLVPAGSGSAQITVAASGAVSVAAYIGTGSATVISLDVISFDTSA